MVRPMKDHANPEACALLGAGRYRYLVVIGRGIEDRKESRLADRADGSGRSDRSSASATTCRPHRWLGRARGVLGMGQVLHRPRRAMASSMPRTTDLGDSAWIVGITGIVPPRSERSPRRRG
jgi:hypothetical protein